MTKRKVYNYVGVELASIHDMIDMVKKSKPTERYKLNELAIYYFGLENNWTKEELIENLEEVDTELDADGNEDPAIGDIRLQLRDHFNVVKFDPEIQEESK